MQACQKKRSEKVMKLIPAIAEFNRHEDVSDLYRD